MSSVPDSAWESRCKRCGRCCYEKLEYEGTVYYTPVPCDKLDLTSGLCSVYERRHEVRPGCAPLTAEHLNAGVLPADCPYVEGIEAYPAPVLTLLGNPDAPTLEELREIDAAGGSDSDEE